VRLVGDDAPVDRRARRADLPLGDTLPFAFLASLEAVVAAVGCHDLRLAVDGVGAGRIAALCD
jgi:hypothetical protein